MLGPEVVVICFVEFQISGIKIKGDPLQDGWNFFGDLLTSHVTIINKKHLISEFKGIFCRFLFNFPNLRGWNKHEMVDPDV